MNYKHVDSTANLAIFAKPRNINETLKIRVTSAAKQAGTVKLNNVKSELKTNSVADVLVGGVKVAEEAIAITTTISGSLENKDAVRAEVEAHIANLTTMLTDITAGWKPDASAVFATSVEE